MLVMEKKLPVFDCGGPGYKGCNNRITLPERLYRSWERGEIVDLYCDACGGVTQISEDKVMSYRMAPDKF